MEFRLDADAVVAHRKAPGRTAIGLFADGHRRHRHPGGAIATELDRVADEVLEQQKYQRTIAVLAPADREAGGPLATRSSQQ